jgi:hypothetical protein
MNATRRLTAIMAVDVGPRAVAEKRAQVWKER